MQRKIDEYVTANLAFLTKRYPSILRAAEELNINRQQLTKYLSGSVLPSVQTLNRILANFDIPAGDIFLPPREFEQRWREPPRITGLPPRVTEVLSALLHNMSETQVQISRFCGNYHGYIRLRTNPYKVARVYMSVAQDGVFTMMKIIGFATSYKETGAARQPTKIQGIAQWVGDRIYMMDAKDIGLPSGRIQSIILYPPIGPTSQYLRGTLMTTNDARNRSIFANPVSFIKLGEARPSKLRMQEVGVFREDDPRLDRTAMDLISETSVKNDYSKIGMPMGR